jgi:folate-binding protein YgfZ
MTSTLVVPITRDVIVATGKDTRSFLHSQLSNDIMSLAVGASRYAFVLEPTGKLSAFLRVRCVADDHFVLDVDAGCGATALARLNKFKIRVQCEFVLTTESITAVRGLDADARAQWCARPNAVAAWREGDGAVDVFAVPESTSVQGDDGAFLRERVRCAWPVFGIDIDDTSLPAETGLIDIAVSFTKGCYPGQELVERMDSRGSTAPRRLMRLPAQADTQSARASVGEPYSVAGSEIGRCTSVAGDFALVMVSRAHLNQAEALQIL